MGVKKYVVYEKDKTIILSDLHFWASYILELDHWCKVNGCQRSGVVVSYNTQEDLIMFVIKWS